MTFWFPILLPLSITTLGVAIDFAVSSGDQNRRRGLSNSLSRAANLAFLSTDMWALTTLIMFMARKEAEVPIVLSGSYTILIGVFIHILLYILCGVFSKHLYESFIMDILLISVGLAVVIWTRGSIYRSIELPEIYKAVSLLY